MPRPNYIYFKKKINSKIKPLASANLKTIAIRFPNHKITRTILKKIKFPLAMPSANKSFNVSPVTAKDVFEEFKKKIKLIINGGRSKIGLESTVIDLTSAPKILRPGVIEKNSIEKVLNLKLKRNIKNKLLKSPGLMKKHYSPGIPVFINQKRHLKKSAFIYLGNKFQNRKDYFSLSKKFDLKEAASNLYKVFRIIKKKGYEKIQISNIPNKGCGIAINDRIKRASES